MLLDELTDFSITSNLGRALRLLCDSRGLDKSSCPSSRTRRSCRGLPPSQKLPVKTIQLPSEEKQHPAMNPKLQQQSPNGLQAQPFNCGKTIELLFRTANCGELYFASPLYSEYSAVNPGMPFDTLLLPFGWLQRIIALSDRQVRWVRKLRYSMRTKRSCLCIAWHKGISRTAGGLPPPPHTISPGRHGAAIATVARAMIITTIGRKIEVVTVSFMLSTSGAMPVWIWIVRGGRTKKAHGNFGSMPIYPETA
jgi:hypothetical protein